MIYILLFKVVNNAGAPIELFWINAYAKKGSFEDNLVLQTTKPIRNSSDTSVSISIYLIIIIIICVILIFA